MTGIEELEGTGALRELIGGEQPGVFVDFWSPWCAPCRTMKPHLLKLAEEHALDWRFVAVNAQSESAEAEAYGVRSLPTLIFFQEGAEAFRFAGATTISSIAEKLEELT